MAIVSTWVSPRVNRPEPWARGRTPTSTEIWRSSVRPRPSIRMPSSRASWRATFLLTRLNRLLLTRASRRAASWSALLSPPVAGGADGVGEALAEGLDPARQVVAEPDQQVGGRLGVRAGPVGLGELDAEEARQRRRACSSRGPGSPRGRSSGCRGSGRTRCGSRRRAPPRGSRGRSRPSGRRSSTSPTNSSACLARLGRRRRLLDVGVV